MAVKATKAKAAATAAATNTGLATSIWDSVQSAIGAAISAFDEARDPTPQESKDAYLKMARRLGIKDVDMLRTVGEIESRSGFENGKPTIRFEPHQFSKRTNRAYDKDHPNASVKDFEIAQKVANKGGQPGQWNRFEEASKLNEDAAVDSTSWGRFQVMGGFRKHMGEMSAEEFRNKVSDSWRGQFDVFESFLAKEKLADKFNERNFEEIAQRYNGRNYYINRYDLKLLEKYSKLKRKDAWGPRLTAEEQQTLDNQLRAAQRKYYFSGPPEPTPNSVEQ